MYLVKPVGDFITLNVNKNISFICFYHQAPRRLKEREKLLEFWREIRENLATGNFQIYLLVCFKTP